MTIFQACYQQTFDCPVEVWVIEQCGKRYCTLPYCGYQKSQNDMQAAGRTAQNILLYQTPLQTVGWNYYCFLSVRNNHIISVYIFS